MDHGSYCTIVQSIYFLFMCSHRNSSYFGIGIGEIIPSMFYVNLNNAVIAT